ncbi:hypothetical protein FACS189413_10400 [Bacteroidia bacterium]|nr:hypothetical protein FACS189413_10400 [Bacteroidia bacterium]
MKKVIDITVILFCAFIFTMCSKDELIQEVSEPDLVEETFVQNEYNLDLRDFALAVSNAMTNSKDFRKLIKKEALAKFDGDYDVLLSTLWTNP